VGNSRTRDGDDFSDEVLLSGMAVGDHRAELVFVRRYQHRLFGLAMRIVGDATLAEDVAQEAFLRIFRRARTFDPRRGSVTAWVLTITRNLSIDAVRLRRGSPTDPQDEVFRNLISADRQPEEAAIIADALDHVRFALRELPIEQRRAVVLAGMYGRTAMEIAAAEAIPVGTAKGRIRLGMDKLREAAVIEAVR
jgi:RNA polymerase sigma factor (sigma-70 family)